MRKWVPLYWLGTLALATSLPAPVPAQKSATGERFETLQADRDELIVADRAALASLSALKAELAPRANGEPMRFVALPEMEEAGSNAADPAAKASAETWLALAKRAASASQLAMADDCLRRAIARDPDLAEARRLLGFLRDGDRWLTPDAARKLKAGQALHPTFGWVPSGWVEKLDQGLLPGPGGSGAWLPAEQADLARQADFARAWRIETPHFEIRANVPLAEGIEFGRRLEVFHQLFGGLMADVIGPDRSTVAALARKPGGLPSIPAGRPVHRVRYFATKQEYVDALRSREGPAVETSLGVYIPREIARGHGDQEASYFFADPGGQIDSVDTLYHEVSHQLLFELSGPSRHDRNIGNFWVFEGLGTYFETVRPQGDGTIEVGGKVGPRMAEAKRRIVDQGEFIPTQRLVAMSRAEFNADPGIYLHYAESMAVVAYLMDGDGGALRAPFLQYVADAYRGRLREAAGRSLEKRLGISYEELDQRVKVYLAGP